MNITPVSIGNTNSTHIANKNFKGLTIMPAAKESIEKNINRFYGGNKSLNNVYKKLESFPIRALDYLKIEENSKNSKLKDLNVKLHNVYCDKQWDTISYLYSAPDIAPGFFMLTSKESVLKNPVEVFKQAMMHHKAGIEYLYG